MKAELVVNGKKLVDVHIEYALVEGVTKSDMVLAAMHNQYEIRLTGGDIGAVRDIGAFTSFVLALIEKEPKCVSQLT